MSLLRGCVARSTNTAAIPSKEQITNSLNTFVYLHLSHRSIPEHLPMLPAIIANRQVFSQLLLLLAHTQNIGRITDSWQNISNFLLLTKRIPRSMWNSREYVWSAILNWWTPGDTVIYAHEWHPFPYSTVFLLLLRYTVNRSRCGLGAVSIWCLSFSLSFHPLIFFF